MINTKRLTLLDTIFKEDMCVKCLGKGKYLIRPWQSDDVVFQYCSCKAGDDAYAYDDEMLDNEEKSGL